MTSYSNFKYAAADDDPLPAIDGLRISGEAFPGRELQASGYSINGTTSCNFGVLFLTPVPLFQQTLQHLYFWLKLWGAIFSLISK